VSLRISLLGILFISAGAASAVSKVGGGTLSNETIGVMTRYSPSYNQIFIAANQDVQFFDSNRNSPLPKFIRFHLLENAMPEWIGKADRTEFAGFFSHNGWTSGSHQDPCVEIWVREEAQGINVVTSWGDGKGALIVTPKNNIHDVRFLLLNLTLDPGACAWK